MGDHEGWAQPIRAVLNGLLPNDVDGVTRALDADRWSVAEARTAELIELIQPNQSSEERRNAVASYVQRLIMKCFSCQVFTFGSVPLKTYLPDGDIDMTAFSKDLNLKDTWADEVRDMLESEEKSENAEFRVKEVQYIQAEVKIIKCLVENIVVDISFNQLGGLCTLCFLEEVDQFINQDHLFKHSIILIKAWCYYESRILGAHHGLISTYALEILVLYIFHIFNNSFAGPLEVLYRFLEFFSNFDWDNYCLSLWGPVPISSLPDMTAEPPRRDNEKLLLSKLYLDACSSMYSVSPGSQENQGQPFVSKFFNVIDPLRTNNNLGRSVSKGNFYRIRSAFSFGAKRLAGLLECPKDDLISEVSKFFMNTWRQHGTGPRPDATSPNLRVMQSLGSTGSVEEFENLRNCVGRKMMVENVGRPADREYEGDRTVSLQGIPSLPVTSINQPIYNVYRTGNLSATSAHNQRYNGDQNSSRIAAQVEGSLSSSEPMQSDRGQRPSRADYLKNECEGSGRFQFARTRSSPELSNTSADVLSRRRNKVSETVKNQNSSAKPEHASRRKNLGSEMAASCGVRSSANDPLSGRTGSSNHNCDLTADLNCTSNNYHEASGFATRGQGYVSFPEVLEMQQQEQDLINMMAASGVGNLKGQVELPMNMSSTHLPFPSSSALAPMAYLQRNLAGLFPENLPLIKPHWGPFVQFPTDVDSSQMPNCYPYSGLSSNPEEFVESGNESSSITEAEAEDADHGFWQDQDNGSTRMSSTDDRDIQVLHSDDKSLPSAGRFNSSFPRANSYSGSSIRGQHKLARNSRGLTKEDFNDTLNFPNSTAQDTYSPDRHLNSRFMGITQASSSRSKSSSESSWDGSSTKVSRLERDKRGRKTASSVGPSPYVKSKSEWQNDDSSSDHVQVFVEDDNREWIQLSTTSTDVVEKSIGSTSIAPMQAHVCHSLGHESTQTSSSDSVVPVAPVLVSANSRPRTGDNTEMVSFAFYPTGPPVPFLTMLPVYPYDSRNSDRSISQFDNGRLDNGHINPSDQNFDSIEEFEQPDVHISSDSMKRASFEHSEDHKPDILNSDRASHWQNLQFGRFCQNTPHPGPLMYSSPVVVPPMYLQGHFPWDGPGRPLLANMNLLTQIMNCGPRFVPVAPLQQNQSRPSSMYRRYGDEVPRYRGGTGTYLPNPKVSFSNRQSSNPRNHRGNYGFERNDHGDREGSWTNSKFGASGRGRGRSQTEKPSSRSERLSMTDDRRDRPWDSYKHEPGSYQKQNSSFSSTSIHNSASMTHGMYPLPAVNSNVMNPAGPAVPSVMMLYSCDPGAGCTSSSEQLKFGSLRPVHLPHTGEVPQGMDGGPIRDVFDKRHGTYQQDPTHSSPDQPSSPQTHQR